jgi:ABC-type transport system involved in multi-copper enzyme maturation permease subunit
MPPVLPGPIFNVELLTSARRTRYFFIRAIYATVLLIALGLVYQSATYWEARETVDIHILARISAQFFNVLAWLQLLAVVGMGPAMVAGTIATERERRTIEYLFASSLSNAEIVLGKLAARIVHVVYLVLTGVPILALMMLLGGIAPEAVLVLTIITLCTVLTISTLSIAISVWSARAREAVTRTYLLLFAVLVLPVVLDASLRITPLYGFVAPLNEQLLAANPFWILTAVVEGASSSARAGAFDMLLAFVRNHLILSFLLAAAATWGVRRTHLRASTRAARRRRRFSHFFRPAVGNRPMLWKELFAEPAAARLGTVGRIAAALIVIGVILPTIYAFLRSGYGYQNARDGYLIYAATMGTILACGGLLLAAARAAGSITSERERDCWMSLIATPLEPSEIVWAKIAGSVWSIRSVAALLLLIWGLAVLLSPDFIFVIPFLLGTFLLLAFYAAALGVNYSLRCRNSLRAMAATLATGLFIGGLYMFCCMPVMFAGGPGPGEGFMLVLSPCVPFLLAFPIVVYAAGEEMFRSPHNEAVVMLLAYIFGTVGYTIAGIALAASSIGSFDRLAGRTVRWTAMSLSRAMSAQASAKPAMEPPKAMAAELAAEAATDAILLPPPTPDIL